MVSYMSQYSIAYLAYFVTIKTMAKLKSELTWSYSRDRLFKECKRAYYYHYYASWGGWDKSADEFTKKAYILKNMRNIDIWVGDIIHQIIKWILESKISADKDLFRKDNGISYDDAAKKAKQLLMKTWEQSRSQAWRQNVKNNLNLFEHYYGPEPTREELSLKLQKVTKSLSNFYSLKLLDEISKLSKENFLGIDMLDSFDFEGTKIFAVPDFAILNSDYLLYDWKTGRITEKDILQLSCYALYASTKWGAKKEKIKIFPVYLSQEVGKILEVECIEVEKVKEYIRQSLNEMKYVLSDLKNNQADIGLCQKTTDTRRCQRCKFQEICT